MSAFASIVSAYRISCSFSSAEMDDVFKVSENNNTCVVRPFFTIITFGSVRSNAAIFVKDVATSAKLHAM